MRKNTKYTAAIFGQKQVTPVKGLLRRTLVRFENNWANEQELHLFINFKKN